MSFLSKLSTYIFFEPLTSLFVILFGIIPYFIAYIGLYVSGRMFFREDEDFNPDISF